MSTNISFTIGCTIIQAVFFFTLTSYQASKYEIGDSKSSWDVIISTKHQQQGTVSQWQFYGYSSSPVYNLNVEYKLLSPSLSRDDDLR